METLQLGWQLGQALSFFMLAAGAWITIPNAHFVLGYFRERPSAQAPHPELHKPLNHRLLCEPEW